MKNIVIYFEPRLRRTNKDDVLLLGAIIEDLHQDGAGWRNSDEKYNPLDTGDVATVSFLRVANNRITYAEYRDYREYMGDGGDYIFIDGYNFYNTEDIFNQLNESEDEFDWVRELSGESLFPIPDGRSYVIVFTEPENYTQADVLMVLNTLTSLGWNWSSATNDGLINAFFRYFKKGLTPYIRLNTNDRMSYGSNEATFREVTNQSFNQFNPIYI